MSQFGALLFNINFVRESDRYKEFKPADVGTAAYSFVTLSALDEAWDVWDLHTLSPRNVAIEMREPLEDHSTPRIPILLRKGPPTTPLKKAVKNALRGWTRLGCFV